MSDTGRRLALFFDGTWNNPGSRTNVSRLCAMVDASRADEARVGGRTETRLAAGSVSNQITYYHPGVGVTWGAKIRGGLFGYGLSQNIKDGYRWLSQTYEAGDDIFVFGFSRGAYTARSLVGLIRKCGIPRPRTPRVAQVEGLVKEAYHIYREKAWTPDGREADAFKKSFSWPDVDIRFVGVWDTVGALGIPVHHVPFSSDYYRWHDTDLSRIVRRARHALAIDEHRPDFRPTLWSKSDKPGANRDVEQRWFPGAHADVGGGYPDGALWQRPLWWMQKEAAASGLRFAQQAVVGPDSDLSPIHDSFGSFVGGLYRRFPTAYAYYRARNLGVHETIDESVWDRIARGGLDERGDPYRPLMLAGATQPAALVDGSVAVNRG